MQMYQLPLSLYSFKVRLALALQGVRMPLVEPHEGTYRSAAYRAVVPTGTIPALVGHGLVLTESDAIIEYLDETEAASRLVDGTPQRKARARMLSRLVDLQLEPQVRALFGHLAPSRREAPHVVETCARLADKLALMEWALDRQGPFAIDGRVSLPDCGLAATLTWVSAIAPVLPQPLRLGPRLTRVDAALATHPVAGAEVVAYRVLVEAWVAGRSRA